MMELNMKKLVIPLADISQHRPCHEQYTAASTMYPDGIPLTKDAQQKLLAADIDYWWLERLLSAPAWAKYELVRDLARAEYWRVTDSALAEYAPLTAPAPAPALAQYELVRDSAWAQYRLVRDSAWAQYERVRGPALLDGLKRTYRDRWRGV